MCPRPTSPAGEQAPPFPKEKTQSSVAAAAIYQLNMSRDSLAELSSFLKEGNKEASLYLADVVMGMVSKALSLLQEGPGSPVPLLAADSPNSYDSTGNTSPLVPPKPHRFTRKRPRSNPYLCVRSKTLDDGFSWRKYGQKQIQFQDQRPRSYYRCRHRNSSGCEAQRQVQTSEDDPSIYLISYIAHHTCRDADRSPFNTSHQISSAGHVVSPSSSACGGWRQDLEQEAMQLDAAVEESPGPRFCSSIGSICSMEDEELLVSNFFTDLTPYIDEDGNLSSR